MEKTPKQIADDIMDQACLGDPYVRNGVDAALRKDIAAAIREAEERERKRIAQALRIKAVQHGENLRGDRALEAWRALSRFAAGLDP